VGFVFNDLEWLVALANPQSDEIAKFPTSTVDGSMCECADHLVIGSYLFLTAIYMAEEAGCRIVCTCLGAGWQWMAEKTIKYCDTLIKMIETHTFCK
jgi:hypothetical protein